MAGRGWTAAIVLVILVDGGALAFVALDDEPERVFCSTVGGPLVEGPPGWNPEGGYILGEDHSPSGEDPCDNPTDGSYESPVVRGDDCTIVYPDDWPEAERTHTSVQPFGVDGTCWYAIDEDD